LALIEKQHTDQMYVHISICPFSIEY